MMVIQRCKDLEVWLEFSNRSGYLIDSGFTNLQNKYEQIGAMLYKLMKNWKNF